MHYLLRRRYLWLAVNFAGMGAYLWLAASLWTRPGEEGEPGGPGDAFFWLFFLVPILASYLAINAVALVAILRRLATSRKRSSALVLWLITSVLWAEVVAYDHHRSIRYINAEYVEADHSGLYA